MRYYLFAFSFVSLFYFGFINKKKIFRSDSYRVLIVGNSIVHHGPKESIGWKGNWGMASSSPSNDMAHILLEKLNSKLGNTSYKIENIANTFERSFWHFKTSSFKNLKDFDADLIILKVGENINESLVLSNDLKTNLIKFVNYIKKDEATKVCIIGSFWPKKVTNTILKKACDENGWYYVDLEGLYQNRRLNTAHEYKDKGVSIHPSDNGMREIANRTWLILDEKIKSIK